VATSPRSSPAIVCRLAFAEGARVEERQQRKLLAELVAGAPEDLVDRCGAGVRPGCECHAHQRGLADAWLALDKQRAAATAAQLF
jgi:hypothetical protein